MKIISSRRTTARAPRRQGADRRPDRRRQDQLAAHAGSRPQRCSSTSRPAIWLLSICRFRRFGSTIGRLRAISRVGSADRIKSFPPTACYSQAHYEAIGGALEDLDRYRNYFRRLDHGCFAGCRFAGPSSSPRLFRPHRQEGRPRRLRTAWPRNDPVAEPAAARARQERGVRRHPRDDRRRIQPRRMAAADGRHKDWPRAARHRRSDHHLSVSRISATTSRRSAALSAPRRTRGTTRPKIAAGDSIRSSSRISENF